MPVQQKMTKLKTKNTTACVLNKSAVIYSEVRSTFSLLVCMIERVLPEMMSTKANKSYLHVNFSPKRQIANKELEVIAFAELQDMSTKSANGRVTIE